MAKRLIDDLNPYKPMGSGIAGLIQGELSHAWRYGVAEGVLRTTKHFNKQRRNKLNTESASDVMKKVFGDDGWWVGMRCDDGSYCGSR